jgi:sterol desaturase/sphingolipid hydroxylase (fatty acid hydroxylase superfamily)
MSGEALARLGAFLSLLALFALWETLSPARARVLPRWRRWPANLALVALGGGAIRLLAPMTAVGAASWAHAHGLGLFNWLNAPLWASIPLSMLAFDLVIYVQHRVFHTVPILWRLHRMHHADLDLDVTTGLRFHPAEVVLSMLLKVVATIALGAPALSVIVFEILLNGLAMFNHSNARLSPRAEAWTRRWIITPDLHEIHHSVRPQETHSNYGFNLTLWDWLFGTLRRQPQDKNVTIGLPVFRAPAQSRLDQLLIQPFRQERP